RSITRVYLLTSTEITGGGGWATLTGEYNAGLSFNIDRNNWGCATSRAFREVACRTASTAAHPDVALFDVRVGFHRRLKLGIFLDVEETSLLCLLSDIQQHADAHQGHEQRRPSIGN